MKNWVSLVRELKQILQTDIRYETIPVSEWDVDGLSREKDGEIQFYLFQSEDKVHYLTVSSSQITSSERQLVTLSLKYYRKDDQVNAPPSEEKNAWLLREWIQQQVEGKHIPATDIPVGRLAKLSLNAVQIPILIYRDTEPVRVSYTDLLKLLQSFFQTKVLLVPLMDGEWLILVTEDVLQASEESTRTDLGMEDMNEALESLCQGLHQMLTSEWVGECHLSISYPIVPTKDIAQSVILLRESIQLGKKYYYDQNLHFPWHLKLERLLIQLSDQDKHHFIVEVFGKEDTQIDQEMMMTLETFFELNCNVSETAKKLYIHRNTLLYRLEKFRQETGLDPRNFNQAVLVKIAALLYKVTK